MAGAIGRKTCDHEKAKFNLARLKKGGEKFEITVDPDLAIQYKTKKDVDIEDVIHSEIIMADAERGLAASKELMKTVFGTDNPIEVAKKILEDGEIQLTAEYRHAKRQEKIKKLIEIIRRNSVDPKTNLPHPAKRIELAFEEVNVKLEELKTAEEQVEEVVKKLRTVLPIKFEIDELEIILPSQYAAKSYTILKKFGKILKEEWQNDGSLICILELPAGLKQDFFDQLNGLTHGEATTKILKTK